MAWSLFHEAVKVVAAALGYQPVNEPILRSLGKGRRPAGNFFTDEPTNATGNHTGHLQRILVARRNVLVIFSRDMRGKVSLFVVSDSESGEALHNMGEELSRAIIQQYIYQTLVNDVRARGFYFANKMAKHDRSICLKVEHWKN